MIPDIQKIEQLPIHLILCTERTGSSMLNAILNQSPEILANSEELFALYLYPKYHNKTSYTEKEIKTLVHDFVYTAEKNLNMFFSDIHTFEQNLLHHRKHLPYPALIRFIYWHFLDLKDKSQLKVIVDKQIKFLYYIKDVVKIFPDSKYIILTRDVRDNVLIRKRRNLHHTPDVIYLAGIWNDTYKNVKYLFEHIDHKNIMIVHYEDLVLNTEEVVKQICQFLNVSFFPEMLNFQENFKKYLELKKEKIGEAYYQKTLDFQSSLFKPISKDKIGLWKKELNVLQLQKIATVCGDTANYLHYNLYEHGTKKLSLADKFQLIKASIKRYWFLKLYLMLPLWLKILIKKVRRHQPVY